MGIPNGHFRKDWQRMVKTWFNQPMRKKRRRVAREAKAAAVAPRPVAGMLRPVVRCPTFKYNSKQLAGPILPIQKSFKPEKARVPSADEKNHKTFVALRQARVNKKLQGMREKKAREAAEKEANK